MITGVIKIIIHNLKNEDPHKLTWKHRSYMIKDKLNYDIFMYIEDDILVRNETILYWLKHKDILLSKNYNLGFLRIERDNSGYEYTPDNSICNCKKNGIIDSLKL